MTNTAHPPMHPIRVALFAAAAGHMPVEPDLDDIAKLAGEGKRAVELRRLVQAACLKALELRRDGENGKARAYAQNMAQAFEDRLPEHVQPDPLRDVDDPRELAAHIPR